MKEKTVKKKKPFSSDTEQQICILVKHVVRLHSNLINGVQSVLKLKLQIRLKILVIYWIWIKNI